MIRRRTEPSPSRNGQRAAALRSELARLHGKVFELEAQLVRVRGDLADRELALRLLKADLQARAVETQEVQDNRPPGGEAEIGALRAELGRAVSETEELRARLAGEIEDRVRMENELAALRRELEASQTRLQQVLTQLTEVEQTLQERQRLLDVIYHSRGFRLIARWWALRAAWAQGLRTFPLVIARAVYRRLPGRIRVVARATYGSLARSREATKTGVGLPGVTSQPSYGFGLPGCVSVVLPVYNQAHLLQEAISSVLGQTYKEFELIIVDDGSTDEIERILGEFARHPNIRILRHPRNLGLPEALNSGFRYARGEFLTWTSADNLMMPAQLERLVAFLRAHLDVAMVYSDYRAIDDLGRPLRAPSFRPHNRRTPDSPEIRLPRSTEQLNVVKDNFIGPSFLYRAWVGVVLGPYDADLQGAEDYDYWMRLNSHFKIAHLGTDELLYQYRVHDNTLNARAAELGIFARVDQLMMHDEERRRFYEQPFEVYADSTMRRVLSGVTPTRDLWAAGTGGFASKILVFLSDTPESLNWFSSNLSHHAPIFTVLHVLGDGTRLYSAPSAVLDRVDCLIADTDDGVRRIRSLGRTALLVPLGAERVRIAKAAANERLFRQHGRRAGSAVHAAYVPGRRKLKVALQVEHFDKGGLERVVYDLACGVREYGWDPVIVVFGKLGWMAECAAAAGLSIVRPEGARDDSSYAALLTRLAPDLINAHSAWFGEAVAHGAGIPFVQTMHNTYVWFSPDQVARCRGAEPYVTGYICVSRNVAKYADLRMGLDPGRMRIVPNGIAVERFLISESQKTTLRSRLRASFGFTDRDFVVLSTAAFYRHKGQLEAVLACRRAVRENPSIKLWLVGERVDPDYFEQVARACSQGDRGQVVVMSDFQGDPVGIYHAADAFIIPSYWEGWSLALAEAIAAGLPAIATDVGATRDLFSEGAVGVVVQPPFEDISQVDWHSYDTYLARGKEETHPFLQALAEAMVFCADRPWAEYDFRQAREMIASKYSVSRMARDYATAFAEIQSTPRSHSEAFA